MQLQTEKGKVEFQSSGKWKIPGQDPDIQINRDTRI